MAGSADYGLGEFTFPRGWFMIATAAEVGPAPKPLRFFGRDLVAYRGESGRVVVMDAYCPHMGAHLAANLDPDEVKCSRIEGDSIRCPYHRWRFGPDGRCDHVPYFSDTIPSAARIRTYPAEVRFGCIFIWHDPEDGEADYDLPEVPEWDDPAWLRCDFDDLGTIPVHPQEIVDNLGDTHHFSPVHGMHITYFDNIIDGPVARQRSGGRHDTMTSNAAVLDSDALYTGPGILIARYGGDTDAVQMILHTPVEDGVTRIRQGIITRARSMPPSEADVETHRAFQKVGLASFAQDFDIWRTKAPALTILRLPTDGPFHRIRAWYRQFYNPRARAAELQARVNGFHVTRDTPAYSRNTV